MLDDILHPIEKRFDTLKFQIKKKFNLFDPIFIYPYRSYGYNGKIMLKGRVLERERVVHDDDVEDSLFRNIHRFYKRYESDEIPGVTLELHYKGRRYEATTDDEGFYNLEISYNKSEDHPFWDNVDLKIVDTPAELKGDMTATGEVMLPDLESNFGIISDVDDTIIESHATNLWLKIKTLAFSHANSRIAFPGVASLYRALVKQKENRYKNPLWFISGSSWNLYDLLNRFCQDKNIPKAPFLLRELDIDAEKIIKRDAMTYKLDHLRPLMKLTDPLPFILIGDSGQKDPEIYAKLAEEYPGRIKAIYIRDVTPDKRDKEVQKIAEELKSKKIDMILASDSLEAAKHAMKNNWISQKDFREVEQEIKEEKKES